MSRRAEFVVIWSDREGSKQLYRLDLKSGELKQLTDGAATDTSNFALSSDDKYLYYVDGPAIQALSLGTGTTRLLHKLNGSAGTLTIAADGSVLFSDASGIGRVGLGKSGAIPGIDGKVDLLLTRPRHSQFLYRSSDTLWLAGTEGSSRKQIKLDGTIGEVLWSPSGQTLLYLRAPDDPKALIELREYSPEEGADKLIARTSQFTAFAPNGDSSVFAGASRSKASAYILILLRVTRRELTLCEHRGSDPALVTVAFAPDSQSVFFTSDRHGKLAVYRVHVERFVEETTE